MKKPRPRAIKQRAAKTAAVTQPSSALAMEGASAAAEPARKKPRVSPVEFYRQVIAEGRKITWPSRKETTITSVMVFVMVVIMGVFFMITDYALHWAIDLILKLANSGSLSS